MNTATQTNKGNAMKKSITWTTQDGRDVNVNIELVTSEIIDANMGISKRVHDIDVTATVAGTIVGTGHPVAVSAGVIVAAIGQLGLTADKLYEVQSAISDVDASDTEWHEMVARNDADAKDYDNHCDSMHKAMSY